MYIVNNLVFHKLKKYIEIDCHFIREKITSGENYTKPISENNNERDMLTKPIGVKEIMDFLIKLHVYDPYHAT